MRNILLDLLIPAALFWGLTSAERSTLVLNWIWFQRPYSFSYGFWARFPAFRIAVVFMVISNAARGNLHFKISKLLVVYLLLLLWLTISAIFSFYPPRAWSTYQEFLPSMWVSPVLMYAAINRLEFLKKVIWVAAGSIGLIAVKTAIVLTAKGGGHLTTQINGFVGDNNVFGLVLCVVFAVLMGLRETLPQKKWVIRFFYFCIVFIVLCIIYTESRGAMLTLGIILVARAIIGRNRLRNMAILFVIAVVAYSAIPTRFFHRLSTLDDIQANASAMGRLQNWQLAWNEAVKFPILGVGPGNHIPYNLSIPHTVQVRVAHSVYFEVLGEEGFVGLFIYLSFCLTALGTLIATWRYTIKIARDHPDLSWTKTLASWLTCAYIGYLFGSAFLNMLYIEFPWYVPFYAGMLRPLIDRAIVERAENRSVGKRQIDASTRVLNTMTDRVAS